MAYCSPWSGIQAVENFPAIQDTMSDPPVPTVLAMLVCDQVIIDELSKKKSLIGVFENVNAMGYPTSVNCAVYAKIVDAEGHYVFKLRIVNLKDESLIAEIVAEGDVNARLQANEFAAHLIGVQLPEHGKYEIQLWANDVYLSRVTLNAVLVNPGRD
jgi:hypothetical protein